MFVKKKRAKPTQADAVLVDQMADGKRSDLAAEAAERPLDGDYPDTADAYTSEPEVNCGHTSNEPALVQLAKDASRLPENPEPCLLMKSDRNLEEPSPSVGLTVIDNKSRQQSPERLRVRPKIHTRPLTPLSNGVLDVDYTQFKRELPLGEKIAAKEGLTCRMNTSEMKVLNGNTLPSTRLPTSRPDDRSISVENESLATLSKYTIPNPQGSHMDILPAMQNSPPQSANSPIGLQSLPSIHSKLGSLVDGPIPPDRGLRITGNPLQNSPSFPHFGSIQSRTNCQFHHGYPTTEPSPASTVSEASPRDVYRHSQDPTSMSPPGKYARQFPINSMTPQSEVQTPLSAESLPSASSFSTETSPNGDRMSIDGDRPILPPLDASAPMVGAGFRCDYTGCTASPFQTQYLLK
ncbi:hypothetical protein MMC27_008685 [Xylographa pallens]|nr:hypothetical protein [Xylographa pallens]